nr:MAG TPA: hypothetical protein [Caudoviricetes sp.]
MGIPSTTAETIIFQHFINSHLPILHHIYTTSKKYGKGPSMTAKPSPNRAPKGRFFISFSIP